MIFSSYTIELPKTSLKHFRANGFWNDLNCQKEACVACQIPTTPVFVLRGLCIGSAFDAHYGWTGDFSPDSEIYYFRGVTQSLLEYDNENSEWRLSVYGNPSIYATTNESVYPFGTMNWYFYGDTCQQIGAENVIEDGVYKLPINFNGCDPNKEFNCRDGTW